MLGWPPDAYPERLCCVVYCHILWLGVFQAMCPWGVLGATAVGGGLKGQGGAGGAALSCVIVFLHVPFPLCLGHGG